MKIPQTCLVIIFVICSVFSFGQRPLPRIINSKQFMGKEHDYPVFDIESDSTGLIHILASNSIISLTGFPIKLTKPDFESEVIEALYKDYHHKVWFSRMNGEFGYLKDGKLVNWQMSDTLKSLTNKRHYESIYCDSSGLIYLAVRDNGYTTIDGEFINHYSDTSLNGYVVSQLDDGHWFHYSSRNKYMDERHVYFIDKNGNSSILAPITEEKSYYQSALVEHNDGSVSLSIGDHSIYKIDKNKLIQHYYFKHRIIKLFVDSKNNLWIGTIDHGFFMAENSDLNKLSHMGISGAASVIAEGINGELWFNSDSMMLGLIPSINLLELTERTGYPMFENVETLTAYGDSLIVKNREGELYILFNDHLKSLNPPKKIHIEGTNHVNEKPRVIRYDDKGKKLWLAYRGRLQYWDGQEWVEIHFTDRSFGDPRTIEIKALGNGRILGATYREIYEVKNNKVVRISETSDARISSFDITELGEIWVTRDDGIWFLDDGIFVRPKINLPDSIFNSKYIKVVAAQDCIWLNNLKGSLYTLDKNQLKEVIKSNQEGLGLRASFKCQNGDLWFFSELHQNMYQIKRDSGEVVIQKFRFPNFVRTGFHDKVFLATEKKVYLATPDGLIAQSIDQLSNQDLPVNVKFSEVRVNHKQQRLQNSLTLDYNENNLTISFEGICFYGLPVHYSYKMEGQDDDWIESDYSQVQYTNLKPGHYQFLVRAGIPLNGWSKAKVITLFVKKPFWTTTWFISITVVLSLLLIWILYRSNTIKRKHKKALDFELNNNRQLALRKSMNPHFIFNSLNSIRSFVLQDDREGADTFIAKFGQLMRDYLEASINNAMTIKNEMSILDRYIEIEQFRLKSSISLTYAVDNLIDINRFMVPTFIIQPFVENSIWHGLSNQKKGGVIAIRFSLKKNSLEVQITDNGIGISEINDFGDTNSSHILRKRLKLISQQYNQIFEFERTNNLDLENDIIGCKVILTLPIIIQDEHSNY